MNLRINGYFPHTTGFMAINQRTIFIIRLLSKVIICLGTAFELYCTSKSEKNLVRHYKLALYHYRFTLTKT